MIFQEKSWQSHFTSEWIHPQSISSNPRNYKSNSWGYWNLHQSFKTTKSNPAKDIFSQNGVRQSQITNLPKYKAPGAPTKLEPLGLKKPYQSHKRTSLIPEWLFLAGMSIDYILHKLPSPFLSFSTFITMCKTHCWTPWGPYLVGK